MIDVTLSTGEKIETKNLIWTAGVTAMTFEGIPAASYGQGQTNAVRSF